MLTPEPSIEQIRSDLHGSIDESLLDCLLTGTVTDLMDDFFESPEGKALFVAAYEAGDPSSPGSPLTRAYEGAILHTPDENFGIVRGCMRRITQAVQSAMYKADGVIRTDVDVAEIETAGGCAIGVRLATGETLSSPVVVSNADPKRTFSTLVSKSALPPEFTEKISRFKANVSCFKFHVALNELPDLSGFLGAN